VDDTRAAWFFDFVIPFGSKFWKMFKIKDPLVQRNDVSPERTDKGQMGSGRFFDRFFEKQKVFFWENRSFGSIWVLEDAFRTDGGGSIYATITRRFFP
jgi:hypothetical protein